MTKSYNTPIEGGFYINWGRWADSICGPFDTYAEAQVYANRTKANNAKIVTLAPPLNTWIIEWAIGGGLYASAKVKAKTIDEAKNRLAMAGNIPLYNLNYAGVEA